MQNRCLCGFDWKLPNSCLYAVQLYSNLVSLNYSHLVSLVTIISFTRYSVLGFLFFVFRSVPLTCYDREWNKLAWFQSSNYWDFVDFLLSQQKLSSLLVVRMWHQCQLRKWSKKPFTLLANACLLETRKNFSPCSSRLRYAWLQIKNAFASLVCFDLLSITNVMPLCQFVIANFHFQTWVKF